MKRSDNMVKGFVAGLCMAFILTGCGSSGGNEPAAPATDETAQTQTDDTTGSDTSDQTQNTSADTSAASTPADNIEGKWVYAYTLYKSETNDGEEYNSCTMCTDEYSPESFINISKKDGKLIADYKYAEYEYSNRIFGNELKYLETTAYSGCENDKWHLEFSDPYDDMDYEYKITLLDDGRLIICHEYVDDDADYGYYSLTADYYLRETSPLWDDPEELKYFDTVTVSNAKELLNSIQGNRRIRLESGTYDFSGIKKGSITNTNVFLDYDGYTVNEVSNLSIEAEPGAQVLFSVSEAYNPVLKIQSGSNISVKGITAGHDVEPGYCSGSVLYFDSISGLNIQDCHLYGCGTYGIEARYCYDINVERTEIYECTYGLLSLTQIGNATFTDCLMRDSSDMDMIDISGCYEVVFDNCEFKNNNAKGYETCTFVNLNEYDKVTFRNCKFSNNEYYAFSNREVTLENCESDNNHAGFDDLINTSDVPTKDDLLKLYEEAKTHQEEIDNKVSTDALLDQLTLNQLAYEEFDNWDSLLNKIWAYLKETLSEEDMTALTEAQQKWIKEKEAAVKEAGSDFEGGSMQPMIENSKAAELTKAKVEELVNTYLK